MEYSLEKQLKQHIRKRRNIEALLCVLFLAVAIGFAVAYGESRVVEELDYGFFQHQSVSYNDDLGFGVFAGAMGLCICGGLLLGDLLFSRVASIQAGNDRLIFYSGFSRPTLYVNGTAHRAQTAHYLEAPLSDGSRAIVSLGKWSAHISFTNGHPAVDI